MSDVPVATRRYKVKPANGLHLRPWSQFVKLAHRYKCQIEVVKDSARSDGRSMLSLLTLAAKCGDEIVVECRGDDAEAAVAALAEFLDSYVDVEE
ncbi:MAG: HPr family phosphocarrier protein [Planctomycetaceae bacterium]|nr:HPr family phosphocarrier protein [Planctomycetaceae bacterium]